MGSRWAALPGRLHPTPGREGRGVAWGPSGTNGPAPRLSSTWEELCIVCTVMRGQGAPSAFTWPKEENPALEQDPTRNKISRLLCKCDVTRSKEPGEKGIKSLFTLFTLNLVKLNPTRGGVGYRVLATALPCPWTPPFNLLLPPTPLCSLWPTNITGLTESWDQSWYGQKGTVMILKLVGFYQVRGNFLTSLCKTAQGRTPGGALHMGAILSDSYPVP